MSVNKPLFYKQITALSRQKHSDLAYDNAHGYRFAQETNSVPVCVSEFAAASRVYPIVFVIQNGVAAPVAVLGTQPQQNVWIDTEGHWLGDYVPAYVRRYPFISVRTSEHESTLCIDALSDTLNTNNEGIALFDEQGDQSEFLKQRFQLAEAYETEMLRNKRLSSFLLEHDLLEPAQLNEKTENVKTVLSGFMVVSRARLEALDKEVIAELHQEGALELIYQHLFSLECFNSLAKKCSESNEVLAEGAA
ncbi:SapC family protein [Neptuniibacter sp. QD72_48]|uniref:SapC family protein n=1 Tax=unclassified Neptuniibacter TaxID=2630693 RepID=UPI0039F4C26E